MGLSSTHKSLKGCAKMDFPKKETQALLEWMRGQMYGDTVTEWTYGNEHDRMSEAADFLSGLLSREGGETDIYG